MTSLLDCGFKLRIDHCDDDDDGKRHAKSIRADDALEGWHRSQDYVQINWHFVAGL